MSLFQEVSRAYTRWSEKRRHPRKKVVFPVETDFTIPHTVVVAGISRGGLVLSGVESIGMRNGGLVQFCLPGTEVTSLVKVQICWKDRQGRLGVKFVEFQGGAPDWDSWFAANPPDRAEANESDALPPPDTTAQPLSAAAGSGFRRPLTAQAIAQRFLQVESDEILEVPAEVADSAQLGEDERDSFRRDLQRVLRLWWLWLLIIVLMTFLLLASRAPDAPAALLQRAIGFSRNSLAPASKPVSVLPTGVSVEIVEGRPVPQSGSSAGLRIIGAARALTQSEISYPVRAMEEGVQGNVEAVLMINTRGLVEEVRITHGDPQLAQEVITAASHWRYSPFQTEFGRIAVKLPVTVKFRKSEAGGVRR